MIMDTFDSVQPDGDKISAFEENNNSADNSKPKSNVFPCSAWYKLPVQVQDLVLWRHPIQTGLTFVGLMTVLISMRCLSLISVVAYSGLAVMLCCLSLRLYHEIMKMLRNSDEPNPLEQYLEDKDLLDVDWAVEKLDKQAACLSKQLEKLRDILLLKSYLTAVKFGALMYLLTILGSWFNLLTIIQLGLLYAFSYPKIYEMYQPQIDEAMRKLKEKSLECFQLVKEKLSTLPVIGPKLKTQ